jgi:hypothetical protein
VEANAWTPRDLFDGALQYEIPVFQRPYVWNEADQWEPLWIDVRRVAERVLLAGEDVQARRAVGGHFLGAIVLKTRPPVVGEVTRHSVIDGQQRTTTLQLLLDAAQNVIGDLGFDDEAEALEELVLNSARRFAGTSDRFKLWPARSDRAAFEHAMDDSLDGLEDSLITDAHDYFAREIRAWLVDGDGDGDASSVGERVAALGDVLQSRLFVVAINLAGHDDDQVIFETLNDRGTPLLKADLIKNWVFQRGERTGADIEAWPDTHWADFEDHWWREEISQGRSMRSRIDLFLQYWLTMRRGREVLTDEVFRTFVEHADERMADAAGCDSFLDELRRDASTFRSLPELGEAGPEGRFHARVVESLELGATTPLLLWMLSDNHRVPPEQVERALGAVESWAIRRTVLRRTMKDVNKMMVALIATLDADDVSRAGDAVVAFLEQQDADSRSWPTDREVVAALPGLKLYGSVRQSRLRVVLGAIERRMRTDRHEDVQLPGGLDIEHVMPRGWRVHWDELPKLDPDASYRRDQLVNSIGNLTLVTGKLNKGALSNRPWTDDAAREVAPRGVDAGLGKRSLLARFSLLAMNKELVDEHVGSWSEHDIVERSTRFAQLLCAEWPGPAPVS